MFTRRPAVALLVLFGSVALTRAAADPPVPDPTPAGTWWVEGNGFGGELVIKVDKDGKIEGSIYGQPIAGTYDPQGPAAQLHPLSQRRGQGRPPELGRHPPPDSRREAAAVHDPRRVQVDRRPGVGRRGHRV